MRLDPVLGIAALIDDAKKLDDKHELVVDEAGFRLVTARHSFPILPDDQRAGEDDPQIGDDLRA